MHTQKGSALTHALSSVQHIEAGKIGLYASLLGFLVDKGCDVNAPDEQGYTPLHLAASRLDRGMAVGLLALMQKKANPFVLNKTGKAPTDVSENFPAILKEDLKKMFQVYRPEYQEKIDELKAEYCLKAEKEKQSNKMFASLLGNRTDKMEKYLLKQNYDPNLPLTHEVLDTPKSPLWFSVRIGRNDMTALFVKAGANIHESTEIAPGYKLGLLELAETPQIVTALVEAGLDPNKRSSVQSPLSVSDIPWHNLFLFGKPECAQELIAKGVDLSMKSAQGFTILQLLQPDKNPEALAHILNVHKASQASIKKILQDSQKSNPGYTIEYFQQVVKLAGIYKKYEAQILSDDSENSEVYAKMQKEMTVLVDVMPDTPTKAMLKDFTETPFLFLILGTFSRLVLIAHQDVEDLRNGGNENQKNIAKLLEKHLH